MRTITEIISQFIEIFLFCTIYFRAGGVDRYVNFKFKKAWGGTGKKLVNKINFWRKLVLLHIFKQILHDFTFSYVFTYLQIFWLEFIGHNIQGVQVNNWYIWRIYTSVWGGGKNP